MSAMHKHDAAVRAHTEQLPEGLQLAVELLDFDRDAFVSCQIHPVSGLTPSDEETATQYLMAIAAVREEHAQRVTLQHHAADQAQRIADLETRCDTLKRLHDAAADEHGKQSPAAASVLAERRRQVAVEGWTPAHDDVAHRPYEMALAACCYCVADEDDALPAVWPWDKSWWKPKDRRRNMVRAAALLLAEIERLDRTALEDSACTASKLAIGGNCDPHHQGWSDGAAEVSAAIRALPLPTGPRQAVLLTDEEITDAYRQPFDGLMDHIYEHGTAAEGSEYHARKIARAIESAVLAANGLEVRRG